jgi:hypothetical protein
MIQTAIVFGMRVALFLLACAVVYAFMRQAVAWVRSDGAQNAERLAAGVCCLGVGSIFSGSYQMMTLIVPEFLEMYVSGIVSAVIGITLLQLGYFLCFTAWLAETKSTPARQVALACCIAVMVVSGAGIGAYYALTA